MSPLEFQHCQLFLDVEAGRPETAACLLSGMQHYLVTYPKSHIHSGRYWDVHHPTNCETYDGKISRALDSMVGVHLNAHVMGVYFFMAPLPVL